MLLENVPGLALSGLGDVLRDLALCGFDAQWDVFSAAEVGAPHQRERIFILAWDVSNASRDILRLAAKRDLSGQAERGNTELGDLGQDVGDAVRERLPRLDGGHAEPEGRPAPELEARREPVADACGGRSQAQARGRDGKTRRRPDAVPSSRRVADADVERRQGRATPRLHDGGQQRDDALRSSARPCWAWPRAPTTQKAGRATSPPAVLNPRFVEALMGLPDDWSAAALPIAPTDSASAATPRSPPKSKKPSEPSPLALSEGDSGRAYSPFEVVKGKMWFVCQGCRKPSPPRPDEPGNFDQGRAYKTALRAGFTADWTHGCLAVLCSKCRRINAKTSSTI